MASTALHIMTFGVSAAIVLLADGVAGVSGVGATADLALVRAPAMPPPRDAADDRALRRSADGLFYTEALVDGRPVRFVVDTGASVTVLSPADAVRIGAIADADIAAAHMDTAAGSAPMRWARPAEISVAGHTVAGVQAAMPTGNVRVSLLGQDVLSRLDSMTLRGDRLTLD